MTNDMVGKVALVTGSASGIGAATAQVLAKRGARVAVVDRNREGAEVLASAIREAGGQALVVEADTSDPEQCHRSVRAAVEAFGKLDIAVNNVGVGAGKKGGVATTDLEPADWDRVIRITLSGTFYGMRYQIPEIVKSGGGAIVNLASITGVQGVVRNAAYVAAKHGVIGLTKAASLEYGPSGVRINSVAPGYIETPVYDGFSPERLDALAQRHSLRRLGSAEEVAKTIAFLVSDESSFVTGSNYMVDGGFTAGSPVSAWVGSSTD